MKDLQKNCLSCQRNIQRAWSLRRFLREAHKSLAYIRKQSETYSIAMKDQKILILTHECNQLTKKVEELEAERNYAQEWKDIYYNQFLKERDKNIS